VEEVSSELDILIPNWRQKIAYGKTDGSKNVRNACKLLCDSRECLQHNFQLYLEHFCTSIPVIASAMSACNYIARLSKTSQYLFSIAGRIPPGSSTRWNSHIECCNKVLNRKEQIEVFRNSPTVAAKTKKTLEPHFIVLRTDGFSAIHDMVLLLSSLMAITIDEEGEQYVTLSYIIPRLSAAREDLLEKFGKAQLADNLDNGMRFENCGAVASWQETHEYLWTIYLEPFLSDDAMQCATILDPRHFLGACLPQDLRKECLNTFFRMLKEEQERMIEEENRDRSNTTEQMTLEGHPSNAGRQVTAARMASTKQFDIADEVEWVNEHLAQLREASESVCSMNLTPEAEYTEFCLNIARLWNSSRHPTADFDPLSIFRINSCSRLKLCHRLARRVLSCPAGEAPSERIFSIASRIIRKERSSMSEEMICCVTFCKKNARALD